MTNKVEAPELLASCPMCGREYDQNTREIWPVESKSDGVAFWRVECDCGLSGAPLRSREQAITAWNRRTPDERIAGLVSALERQAAWHEEQDKAISKQPRANEGDNGWRRLQHQEQIADIREALATFRETDRG